MIRIRLVGIKPFLSCISVETSHASAIQMENLAIINPDQEFFLENTDQASQANNY